MRRCTSRMWRRPPWALARAASMPEEVASASRRVGVLVAGAPADALVAARAEGPLAVLGARAVAGEQDDADVGRHAGVVERAVELVDGVRAEGVEHLGTVEGDAHDPGLRVRATGHGPASVVGDVGQVEALDGRPLARVEDLGHGALARLAAHGPTLSAGLGSPVCRSLRTSPTCAPWSARSCSGCRGSRPSCCARPLTAPTRCCSSSASDNGAWTPVTGIVDPGEDPHVTAVREVEEEACVVAEVERLVWVSASGVVTHVNGDLGQYLDHTFRCRWVSGEPRPGDDESTDARFFPLDALPPMAPGLPRPHRRGRRQPSRRRARTPLPRERAPRRRRVSAPPRPAEVTSVRGRR